MAKCLMLMVHFNLLYNQIMFQLVTKALAHSRTTRKSYRSDLTACCLCTFSLYSPESKPKTKAKKGPAFESEVNSSVQGASDREQGSALSSTSSVLPY